MVLGVRESQESGLGQAGPWANRLTVWPEKAYIKDVGSAILPTLRLWKKGIETPENLGPFVLPAAVKRVVFQ